MESSKRKGLHGPNIDFWLLGGGALFVWALLAVMHITGVASLGYVQASLVKIFLFVAFLDLFVNLPHFIVSYRLAYFQGPAFMRKNQIQLVWVPLFLILLMAASTLLAMDWEPLRAWHEPVRRALGYFGIFGMNSGLLILAFLFVLQYVTVAWHYSKQAFGVTLYRMNAIGQPLEAIEARKLKWSLMCVWLSYFTMVASGRQVYHFGSISYRALGLPIFFYYVAAALIPVSLTWNFLLLRKAARRNNQPVDLAACGTVFSVYCWFAPPIYARVPGFFETLSPFFHSLQYLAFTFRYEINRRRVFGKWLGPALVLAVYGAVILAGVVFYRKLPAQLDLKYPAGLAGFFGLQAFLFLNLHHYWIDNAIWRRTNDEIRAHLR